MKPFQDAFKPFTDKEKSKIERDKRDIAQSSKSAFEAAASCLSSEQFAKYRKEYQDGKDELIQAGIGLVFSDPISYAMAAHSIFMRLEYLGKIEDMIQRDIQRGNR